MEAARRTAERVARTSYGRLVALLAARSRDIAAAEDALGDAFRAALQTWPARGVPDNPEAWLLTAARRELGHRHRHSKVKEGAVTTLELLAGEAADADVATLPDRRLELLFVCAHPALDAGIRTPLMLQTVLGLDAARIGAAFLVAPATMGQRLVRAKAKIRDTGPRFELPDGRELADRLDAVLAAIYAAYGTAWDAAPGAETPVALADEAIHLARLLVERLPDEPEAHGLLALMLYCEARAAARRGADGSFIPLCEQDASRWSRDLIVEAEALLTAATRRRRFGRFQTEAAIQSLHVQRAAAGQPPTTALALLYDVLVQQTPAVGARVARAAAHGEAAGPAVGLALLDEIDGAGDYQPYWATRAHLLAKAGRPGADAAYDRAIGLSQDPAVRAYLLRRRQAAASA